MFQRILLPLDDATRVAAALRIATAIAHHTGAQLVLVRTEPSFAPVQSVIGARTALQRQVNALRQQGIQAEYAVEIGSREDGLVAAARDRQVDLILLVPAQRQHLELLWYARSAAQPLSELSAPLLIWPESQTSIELLGAHEAAVLAPLDGAAIAERSLPFAVMLAERYHQPLLLMQAIPMDSDGNCRDSVRGAGCFSDKVQDAEAYLHAVRERLEATTKIPIQTAVVAGEPGTQLLHAAKTYRAGVIVLCSHSHPRKDRYFMGCVATQILRQADVPILVVPSHLEASTLVPHSEAAAADREIPAGVTP